MFSFLDAFRGSNYLLTRYLEDFGRLGVKPMVVSHIFGIFTSKAWEDDPILTYILQMVAQPPKSRDDILPR